MARVLIIGSLEAELGQAARIAVARGARLSVAEGRRLGLRNCAPMDPIWFCAM